MKALKPGLIKALMIFAILFVPIFGIKWGAAHRDFAWLRFFEKAQQVNFSPDSVIWSQAFSISLPWQEKAVLIVCTLFSAYTFFQLAANIAEFEKVSLVSRNHWRNAENIFSALSYIFLFLYMAACTLCERTNLGTVTIGYDISLFYRIAGVAALIITLAFMSRNLVREANFNGMITRDNVAQAYYFLVAGLGAIAMCFATWLPLLALPGALIMVRFALARIKEIDYLQPETANLEEEEEEEENTSNEQ